jgi:hypothetical protein
MHKTATKDNKKEAARPVRPMEQPLFVYHHKWFMIDDLDTPQLEREKRVRLETRLPLLKTRDELEAFREDMSMDGIAYPLDGKTLNFVISRESYRTGTFKLMEKRWQNANRGKPTSLEQLQAFWDQVAADYDQMV